MLRRQRAGAVRGTGFGMLSSNSIQEVMDMALISQAASLESRLPFVHFFDGFRTSSEVAKIEALDPEDLRALVSDELVHAHRARALSPDHPVVRGTAQNPDVYFQGRETVNRYYQAAPAVVAHAMERFEAVTGRRYRLFDYVGAPDAERILVMMGSGADAAEETVAHLVAKGEKVALLKVRLYRPFATEQFVAALPPTVKGIAVLDRCKEPGSAGEPLYLDVTTAIAEVFATKGTPFKAMPTIIGGRYGLASKEFTPAMAKAALVELAKPAPKNHFTVGGSAATNCSVANGRYSRTLRSAIFSPFATRWATASSAASAPEPIITTMRSASGAPT